MTEASFDEMETTATALATECTGLMARPALDEAESEALRRTGGLLPAETPRKSRRKEPL